MCLCFKLLQYYNVSICFYDICWIMLDVLLCSALDYSPSLDSRCRNRVSTLGTLGQDSMGNPDVQEENHGTYLYMVVAPLPCQMTYECFKNKWTTIPKPMCL